MVKQLSSRHALSTDLEHPDLVSGTRAAPSLPTGIPAASAGPTATAQQATVTTQQAGVRTRAIRQVLTIDVTGLLSDVVQKLDMTIQLALSKEPRGVVCDLSGAGERAEPDAVEMLATAGRHVRDWPAIPVAVACANPRVRQALRAHPLGSNLIVTESTFAAVSAVLSSPTVVVERLRLAAHPTAPSTSRSFVTRILKDWRLDRVIPSASVAVSRLVARSSLNAGTAIDLSLSWNADALRLTVADHGPALPAQRPADPDVQARGLSVAVAGLSRAFGVLPTADGGKLVWAVLDAPRPTPSTRRSRSESGIPTQESPVFTNRHNLAEPAQLRRLRPGPT